MTEAGLKLLRCVVCCRKGGGALTLHAGPRLICETCGRSYAVEHDVPAMVVVRRHFPDHDTAGPKTERQPS